MIYNIKGNGEGGKCSFEDVDENSWYYEAVAWAYTSKVAEAVVILLQDFFPDDEAVF